MMPKINTETISLTPWGRKRAGGRAVGMVGEVDGEVECPNEKPKFYVMGYLQDGQIKCICTLGKYGAELMAYYIVNGVSLP